MKIFVVVWNLVSCYSVPCPDTPKPDAYGRMNHQTMCAVNHMKCDTKVMEKPFATRKEAEEFIKNAGTIPVFNYGIGDTVKDFRIEERE